MSSGVTSTLFFACVVGERTLKRKGEISSAIKHACTTNAMACVHPKFSSLDQMSFTCTGLMPAGITALVGEKNSLTCSAKPPKFPPQSTSKRLLTGVLRTFGAAKKNFRFSLRPEPNEFFVKGTSLRSTILTGRSVKNCLRFDQKLLGIMFAGALKSGTAEAGTGTTSSGPVR